ncbi:type-4 ice-structuring protein LS-12-like [Dunckerocampus dactyliophorus]|uniref:type-4 ice-structuring protein LS-12-like n=1 Tax=Dunckerocampus dactyliophorus TaxID=161453 RepID=UPI0024071238|nr:type-4 ice-structuring protein LS-12-like [Dunckerocampus dactyliophorus]
MKFSIIAAFVVFALAQGSLAQDATGELQRISQYFEEMKNKMTQQLTDFVRTHDLNSQAQTFLEEQKAQFEPLVAKIQEQLQSIATSVEGQVQPMAANVQAQIEPMVQRFQEQMEAIVKQLTEQAKAITN